MALVNTRCPFADPTGPSGAMCMMTSHVFGHMVAGSQNYRCITLTDIIARGSHGCCIVIVSIRRPPPANA